MAYTVSISVFPTNACLIKLVGVGVQTSNSDLHKFYIHEHFHNSGDSFEIYISMLHGSCEKECNG